MQLTFDKINNKYIKIIMEIGMLYDIKLSKISCNTINIYLYDHTV